MDAGNIIRALRPNVTALGYALFLAINAAGVWGGVFPFLPLDFQTPEIVFWFFLAQSLAFSLSYFASAVGVYYYPGPTRSFLVKLAAIPYMLGWCFLVAAIYVDAFALPFVFVGGGLLGLGSAGFYMLWQRLFSSQDSDRGNHDLMLGTAYGAVLYFSLYLIPVAVTAYLIPLVFLPLFGLVIVLKGREIDRDQPMFEDVPHEHPQVYRRAVHDLWRSALCVGALGFCTGIMRSLAIGEPAVGSLVNVLSMAATLVAAVTLLTLWQFKNLRLNVVSMYRVVFPFVITAFLLLPFLVVTYSQWLAAVLYALYSVAIMLMMMQCAQASRDRGINPVFVYGIVGGVVYTLHDIGFLSGTFAEQIDVMGVPPLAAVALVAVYLLGLMYFVGQGGFRKILGGGSASDSIELVALRPHGMRGGSLATDGQSARKKVPAPRRKSNRTRPRLLRRSSSPKRRRRLHGQWPKRRRLQEPGWPTGRRSVVRGEPRQRTQATARSTATAYRSRPKCCANTTAYRRARQRSWSSLRAATAWRASPRSWWCRKTPSARTRSASTPSWTSTRSRNCWTSSSPSTLMS